jgi:cobalamin biosynthesis Mg chelatase CobN
MSGEQNDTTGSRIDLSSVPEPLRSMLLKQLAKMPTPLREQLLREGSPMLDRVIAKARRNAVSTHTISSTAAAADPNRASSHRIQPDRIQTVRHGSGAAPHRVQTVSPGDSASGGIWLVAFVIVLVVVGYVVLHG